MFVANAGNATSDHQFSGNENRDSTSALNLPNPGISSSVSINSSLPTTRKPTQIRSLVSRSRLKATISTTSCHRTVTGLPPTIEKPSAAVRNVVPTILPPFGEVAQRAVGRPTIAKDLCDEQIRLRTGRIEIVLRRSDLDLRSRSQCRWKRPRRVRRQRQNRT